MALKIHHATKKKAEKYGVELKIEVDTIVALVEGDQVAEAASAADALYLAIKALGIQTKEDREEADTVARNLEADAETDEDGEDEEEVDEGASIVKKTYKKRYKPFHARCGDDLSELISAHIKYKDPEDGKERIDLKKLKKFAKDNGCWVDSYAKLNAGQQRMNIGNRLRKRIKDGHEPIWN